MESTNDSSKEEEFSMNFDELEIRKVPPTEASMEVEPEASKKKGSGFLRTCLFWSVGLLGIFALGIAATWVLQVRPRSAEIDMLDIQAETIQAAVFDLEEQLDLILPLEDENIVLLAELTAMDLRLILLRVLLNVKTTQMALMMNDVVGAQEELANSRENLERIEPSVTGAEQEVVLDLINRVDLIQSEIDRDPKTAAQDLTILVNTLITLERAISNK